MIDTKDMPRHRVLRVRAFALNITISAIAAETGYHPGYVSELLRGVASSNPGLDNIEGAIDRIAESAKAAA